MSVTKCIARLFWWLLVLLPFSAFALDVVFTPGITVESEYTDNVDRVNEDPEYDFITSLSPSVALDFIGRSSAANLTYVPSRVYYARTRDNDYWRHDVSLRGNSQLSRHFNMDFGGHYLYSEDPADTADLDPTIRRGREPYYTYSADAGTTYQFGIRNQIGLRCEYGGTENDAPDLEDSNYLRPSFDLDYWFSEQWGTRWSGYFERGKFEIDDDFDRFSGTFELLRQFNRHLLGTIGYSLDRVLYDGQTENERIHDISAGFDLQLDQDTAMALRLGYSIVELPGRDNESGLSSELTFSKAFQRSSITLSAGSGFDYTFFGAENLGFTYYAETGLEADYQLTRRLTANGYANYRYTEYRDLTPQRDDDQFSAGCALSFQLLEWLFAETGYDYETVESNYEVNDFVENRVFIRISAIYSRPIENNDRTGRQRPDTDR